MIRRTITTGAGALAARSGRIRGHPYVRVGPRPSEDGHPPLVLVPGLNDALLGVGDAWPFARAMAGYCGRYVSVGRGGRSGPASAERGERPDSTGGGDSGPGSADGNPGPGSVGGDAGPTNVGMGADSLPTGVDRREWPDPPTSDGGERSERAASGEAEDPGATAVDGDGRSLLAPRPTGERRPVFMISRPHGLDQGATTRKMAADCARVIGAIPGGAADVVGLSMGGFVVTHLAADHPGRVRRAVSLLGADRLDEEGRRRIDGWIGQAAAGNLGAIYRDACDLLATGARRWAMRAAAAAYDRLLDPPTTAREDFLVSARACLDHDAGDRLADVPVPTLVVGGDRDPFFSLRGFRRTARGIPGGRFVCLPGAGHEAVIERGPAVEGAIKRFLRGDPAIPG
ncbi:hypothetical protein BRD00_02590 [Halobacteriales archaeon QS_8_69_26]|nr:MAG: hypothetical protein BRD00_02590 [Halobacteriales archaeon QS_8_69_26]